MNYHEIINEVDACVEAGEFPSDELQCEAALQDIDVLQLYQERITNG